MNCITAPVEWVDDCPHYFSTSFVRSLNKLKLHLGQIIKEVRECRLKKWEKSTDGTKKGQRYCPPLHLALHSSIPKPFFSSTKKILHLFRWLIIIIKQWTVSNQWKRNFQLIFNTVVQLILNLITQTFNFLARNLFFNKNSWQRELSD